MAMQFMCQKSFHPSSKANQRKLWIAEQKAKEDAQRERDRTEELNKERLNMQHRRMVGQSKSAIEELDFMYQTPSGLMKRELEEEAPIQVPVGPSAPENHPKNMPAHPVLNNAPTEGEYVDKLSLKNFRPLGVQIRNVRCARCGQKGHASGDRECPLANINPLDAARKRAEDPASAILNVAVVNPYSNHLVLKDHILKEQLGDDAGLLEEETVVANEDDPEKAFLDSLSKKQKKRLLRHLERQEKKQKKKDKKQKKKDKSKHKKEKSKKRKRSPSSESNTSSSSSGSSTESNSEENPKKKHRRTENEKPKNFGRENDGGHCEIEKSREKSGEYPKYSARENDGGHGEREKHREKSGENPKNSGRENDGGHGEREKYREKSGENPKNSGRENDGGHGEREKYREKSGENPKNSGRENDGGHGEREKNREKYRENRRLERENYSEKEKPREWHREYSVREKSSQSERKREI